MNGNYASPYQAPAGQVPMQQPAQYQAPQQMPAQQPMMEQPPQQQMPDQQFPAQQPEEDLKTGTEEKGKTWLLVTILAGLGIFVMIISLLVLFLTDATTEVDVPSIVVTVSAVFGLVCLA